MDSNLIYLYLKTHNKTGLKYLGKTKYDPFTYNGSGKAWLKHLEEYGVDIDTKILKICKDNSELSKWGRHYSKLWNIVESNDFANLIPETGGGCGKKGQIVTEEHKEKLRKANLGKKQSKETIKKRLDSRQDYKHSEETKQKISEAHKGKKHKYSKKRSDAAKNRKKHPWTGKKRPIVECPHCHKSGADFVMSRWHFDNCKNKL